MTDQYKGVYTGILLFAHRILLVKFVLCCYKTTNNL